MAEAIQWPKVPDEKLDLKVRDSHGAVTHFKVKKSTKFRKILTARMPARRESKKELFALMVDGGRVNLEQCPGDLDMENGDQIDAMVEQQGGLGQDPAAAAVAAALRDNLARQAQIEAALERLRSVMAATLREREAIKRQLIARGGRRRADDRAAAAWKDCICAATEHSAVVCVWPRARREKAHGKAPRLSYRLLDQDDQPEP